MIRFLAISAFCALFLTSCSLETTQGLRQLPSVDKMVSNPYFANPEMDYIYKAKIEVFNTNLGGILIIKKIAPQNHRIVMTTEFGSKLLDFQFENDTFIKNYVIAELDKNLILNVLKNDFRLLLRESAKVMAAYETNTDLVYKTADGKRFNFYFFSSDRLEKIVNTTKSKEKITVNFTSSNGTIAEKISIQHNNFRLKIDLEKFKEDFYAN